MANVLAALPELIDELGVRPRHVVHVGAHEGQELPFYRRTGFERITLVEPIPALAARLRQQHPGVEVVQCACSDRPGRAALYVMRRSNMSTLVQPGPRDQVVDRVEVEVRRLDDVAPTANVAVIDAQGHELAVLAAAPWDSLDLVIVETCTVGDPTMASPYGDVVAEVVGHGFREAGYWARDYGWVDRWARGRQGTAPPSSGEIRDVAFARRRRR